MSTSRVIIVLLAAHFWAILLLGRLYTVWPIAGLFSAHDLVLITLSVLGVAVSLLTNSDRSFLKYLAWLLALAIFSIAYSIFLDRPVQYVARQSVLIIYPILYGMIILNIKREIGKFDIYSYYGKLFFVTLMVQSVLVGLHFIGIVKFEGYIYYSPMMLLIMAGSGAYIASLRNLNIILKSLMFFYVLVLLDRTRIFGFFSLAAVLSF